MLRVLPARAPIRRGRGCAPTCRPSSTVRDSRAPCSLAAGPWVTPATGSRSTARRKSRSKPRAHSLSACGRRAVPAGSAAQQSPTQRPSNHSDNAGPYPTRQPTRGGGPNCCLRGKRTSRSHVCRLCLIRRQGRCDDPIYFSEQHLRRILSSP